METLTISGPKLNVEAEQWSVQLNYSEKDEMETVTAAQFTSLSTVPISLLSQDHQVEGTSHASIHVSMPVKLHSQPVTEISTVRAAAVAHVIPRRSQAMEHEDGSDMETVSESEEISGANSGPMLPKKQRKSLEGKRIEFWGYIFLKRRTLPSFRSTTRISRRTRYGCLKMTVTVCRKSTLPGRTTRSRGGRRRWRAPARWRLGLLAESAGLHSRNERVRHMTYRKGPSFRAPRCDRCRKLLLDIRNGALYCSWYFQLVGRVDGISASLPAISCTDQEYIRTLFLGW